MQQPPIIELPVTYIGAQPPPGKDPIGGGFIRDQIAVPIRPGMTFAQHQRGQALSNIHNIGKAVESEYAGNVQALPQSIENNLAAVRAEGSTHALPPVAAIQRELNVRNTLIQRKTAELQSQTAIANAFYGRDPIHTTATDFIAKAKSIEKVVKPHGVAIQAWTRSYKAAYRAKLLGKTIQLLNNQQVNVLNFLAAAQADEQARIAAETEARRVAAEQARIAAEAEAQRVAAEQARIAEEAEARRVAAEQARIAAELEAKRLAEEHARQEAIKAANTFPAAGAAAAYGPVFTLATGAVAITPEVSIALTAALRIAVANAAAAAAASIGATVGGFALLLIPSNLGNSDRYAVSVPLSELVPDDNGQNLLAIAAAGGEIDVPTRMSSRAVGEGSEVFVTATDGVNVPSTVKVRLATFDTQKNLYTVTTSDSPPRTLTWTPVVTPGNSSTALPAAQPEIPVYAGATVMPVEGRIDTFPGVVDGTFDDYIIIFPADSGVAPVYVMYKTVGKIPELRAGTGRRFQAFG